ncbi:MAG: fused MFS/spermidine synthase [Acidimicrobiia bacterium]|nr:fused MFS/spermidine synthase [Acidimicrobiia bacterium]MDX2466004.1 fused MFS/spermidine synthase [Acidimicrobiia bacterium]
MSTLSARTLVFFASAAVLVLEILASRMMAPYVGVTLETFTGIIGTVLAGIAIGSWLGGRLADRYPPQQVLPPVLAIGGVLALFTYPIVTVVGPSSAGNPLDIVTLASVSFFAPAAVLSAVTPTVTKLRLQTLDETGAVVGRLSAIATAGAIFGTFVAGFVLVAAWPSRTIAFAIGGTLIVAGIALGVRAKLATTSFVIAAVGFAGVAAAAAVAAPSTCEYETAYYCINVDVDDGRPTGRILWLDTLRHSYVDLEDPTHLEFRYAQIFGAVLDSQLAAGPASSLSIGGGGFTFPRYVAATHPGGTNTVLELDSSVVDIAVAELGLDRSALDIRTGDARVTLRDTPAASYDVVIGDAFGGPAVPWHLTTQEFATEFSERLRPGGFYVLNLIDYPPLGFARAQTATLATVFAEIAVIAPEDYLAGERGGNFVLVASDSPLDINALTTALNGRNSSGIVLSGAELATFIEDAAILTDDFAPVDQLITS